MTSLPKMLDRPSRFRDATTDVIRFHRTNDFRDLKGLATTRSKPSEQPMNAIMNLGICLCLASQATSESSQPGAKSKNPRTWMERAGA